MSIYNLLVVNNYYNDLLRSDVPDIILTWVREWMLDYRYV